MISDAAVHDMNRDLGKVMGAVARIEGTILPAIEKKVTGIARKALWAAVVGSFLAHGGEIALKGLEACTPAQLAAAKRDEAAVVKGANTIEPGVFGLCGLAGDVPPLAPYVDLVCPYTEAIDAAVARIPAAKIVEKSPAVPVAAVDGGTRIVTLCRVRMRLDPRPADAATANVVTAVGVLRAIEQTPEGGIRDGGQTSE